MDWSLIIFIAVIVLFGYRGYRKGLFKSLSRVFSLLSGYAAAVLYSGSVATIIESNLPLQGLVALIVASLILFVLAGIAVSIIFWLIGNLLPKNDSSSAVSSYGGATAGLIVGTVIAIVVVWTFNFVSDLQSNHETIAASPSEKHGIESFTNQVASKTVSTALSMASASPNVTQLGAAFVATPGRVTQHAQRLANSNDINSLLSEPENQAILNSGNTDALKKLPAFQQLANNPDMLALAKSAGMMDKTDDGAETVETALADQMTGIWIRMQNTKNDARVQEILNNPEFQAKIQSENPVDILTSTRLLELANIIFSDEIPN